MVDHDPKLGILAQQLASVLDLVQQRVVGGDAVLGDPPVVGRVEHASRVDGVRDRDGHVSVSLAQNASRAARP